MLDDLLRCYEVLGVAPQASAQELKAAYRDLAKVWHPDRFAHEPRLQQKAQEKLKEINDAYAQLTSDRPARRARPTPAAPATERATAAPAPFVARRPQRQTLLLPALLFVVVLCSATTALLVRHKANVSPPAQTVAPAQAQASEQAAEGAEPGTTAAPRPPKKRTTELPPPSMPAPPRDAAAHARNTETLRPMPTVTLLIDPTTNLIATRACPNKMRMTYASGAEPHQLCTAHQAGEPTSGGAARRRVAVR
jgi:hypothetical protein